MTVDQLKDVLEDVVNHQKPESEKCSIVRRLKEETSKDEMSLEPDDHFLDSGNNKKGKSKGLPPRITAQSFGRTSGQTGNSSSQSLQDLASEHGPTSNFIKSSLSSGSRKLNKATRANSFSLASNSVCPPCAPENSQTRSSSATGVGTCTNKRTNNNNGNISTRTLSSSAASSSLNDFSDALTLNSSHVDVNDKNNNNDCDREVEGEPSARHSLSCTSSLKTYSHHSLPADTQSQSAFKDDFCEIEMQDLRRHAQYVQYNSTATNNSVDSIVSFSDLTTREPDDPQYARRIHLDSSDGPSKFTE